MNGAVSFTLINQMTVAIKPTTFLGNGLFENYLAACQKAACLYDPKLKVQIVGLDGVPTAVDVLSKFGFTPLLAPEVRSALELKRSTVQDQVEDAKDRLTEIKDQLKSRGLKLYPFQENGVLFLVSRSSAMLLDGMGLGKTPQSLLACPKGAAVLVICPAIMRGKIRPDGKAIGGWVGEAAKFRPDLRPTILQGRGAFKWPEPGEMVVVNYDILPDPEGIPAGLHLEKTVLIIDEAQAIKNPKAQRTKKVRSIVSAVQSAGGKTWGLTGTPLMNRPSELWVVLDSFKLAKPAFGSWTNFCRVFNGVKDDFWGGFSWGVPSPEAPIMLQRVSMHRRRSEVLPDLPAKRYKKIFTEIDAKTRKLCDEVLERLRTEEGIDLTAEGIDVQGALIEALASKGGVLFEEMSRLRAALATAKIPYLISLVEDYEEDEEPVVVFSAHKAPVEALATREGWAKITGDVSTADRTEIVEQFQAGKLKGLAATIGAAGTGITLTKAAHAIFVDLSWTPAGNAQAEDRICRIGQTRGVLITHLVADHPLDDRVTELLLDKQQIIDAAVDASAVSGDHVPDVLKGLDKVLGANLTPSTEELEKFEATKKKRAREPKDLKEEWARRALLVLAAMDEDRAAIRNGMGFNRLDSDLGHSLAKQVSSGLTDSQWELAIRILRKYSAQVGIPPAE